MALVARASASAAASALGSVEGAGVEGIAPVGLVGLVGPVEVSAPGAGPVASRLGRGEAPEPLALRDGSVAGRAESPK
jgi:hypothetical protein